MLHIPTTAPLDLDTEHELVRRAQAGDGKARETLLRANIRWITAKAREYVGPRMPLDDLVQSGCIGFMRAVEKYVPQEGVSLWAFARFAVRDEMRAAVVAYVPAFSMSEAAFRKDGARPLGRRVELEGVPGAARESVGVDRRALERLVATLPRQKREIIEMAFGLTGRPMSDGEIADVLGVDRSTVTRRRNAALAGMRAAVAGDGGGMAVEDDDRAT